MSNIPLWIEKMNWSLLKHQKETLLRVADEWSNSDEMGKRFSATEIEGVIAILDAMQDWAVDDLGMDEDEVFAEPF